MAAENRKAARTGDAKFSYVNARTILDEAHIYAGEMVQANLTTGEVSPATDAGNQGVLGVSTLEVDNALDGETLKNISTAVHLMDNGGDITVAHVGQQCCVVDAATVGLGAGLQSNANVAGIIAEVTSDGVYVDFDPAKRF